MADEIKYEDESVISIEEIRKRSMINARLLAVKKRQGSDFHLPDCCFQHMGQVLNIFLTD